MGEAIQGQRYLPGQQFKPHNDWFYTSEKYWLDERKRGGQRSWTTMAFLNEVEEGGETHFTDIGIKIEPKPGVLLIWNNALVDGSPNEGTMHAGTPVVKGSKYIITKWYRTRKLGSRKACVRKRDWCGWPPARALASLSRERLRDQLPCGLNTIERDKAAHARALL